MPQIHITRPDGTSEELEFEPGLSLMEVLRDAGYEEIQAMCGGGCSCATCHVHLSSVDAMQVPEMEEDEAMLLMLADNYNPELSRLSCQIPMGEAQAGLKVQIVEPE